MNRKTVQRDQNSFVTAKKHFDPKNYKIGISVWESGGNDTYLEPQVDSRGTALF